MGWVYNLENPNAPTRAPKFIAVTSTITGVALIAVIARLYVRLKVRKGGFGVDDVFVIFSMVMTLGYTIVGILQTRWGQGLEVSDFPLVDLLDYLKVQYAGSPLYTLGLLGFKLGLLFAYLRIGGFNKPHRIGIYIVIAACFINQILFTCILCFACKPISFQWDFSIPGGSCINQLPWLYALASTTLLLDVIIIALPLPVLVKLQLPKRKKYVLIGVFTLGFFITIIQVIRMNYVKNLKTWTDSYDIILWSNIELNLGILACCIPTLGPLFRYFAGMTSTSGRKSAYPDSKYGANNVPSGGPNNKGSYMFRSNNSQLDTAVDNGGNIYHMDHLKELGPSARSSVGKDKTRQPIISHSAVGGAKAQEKAWPLDGGRDDARRWHGGKDNDSEEYIMKAEDGIRATTEVRVEFDGDSARGGGRSKSSRGSLDV